MVWFFEFVKLVHLQARRSLALRQLRWGAGGWSSGKAAFRRRRAQRATGLKQMTDPTILACTPSHASYFLASMPLIDPSLAIDPAILGESSSSQQVCPDFLRRLLHSYSVLFFMDSIMLLVHRSCSIALCLLRRVASESSYARYNFLISLLTEQFLVF